MQRIAMGVSYRGAHYYGWQKQKQDFPTVQGKVEEAIAFVANEPIDVVCAGRTDRGVHAGGQVIHFETTALRDERSWVLGVNTALPSDIRITWMCLVPDDFHARFSATYRQYHYLIDNRPIRSALFHEHLTWEPRPLDAVLMQQGAEYLLGKHDFSAFRGAGCQARTPTRQITDLTLAREGDIIRLSITADAFLLHMVRNIVGTLLWVGRGERSPECVREVLESRDRRQAGPTAAANGLQLCHVGYDKAWQLPNFLALSLFPQ